MKKFNTKEGFTKWQSWNCAIEIFQEKNQRVYEILKTLLKRFVLEKHIIRNVGRLYLHDNRKKIWFNGSFMKAQTLNIFL